MTKTINTPPIRATRLLVEIGAGDLSHEDVAWLDGADGVVVGGDVAETIAGDGNPAHADLILRDVDPKPMAALQGRPGTRWVCGEGLDALLRLRDAWPDLEWLPRVEVYRPETRFDFHRASPGEGFSMYMPDTSAIQGFRVADAERQPLEPWLCRAVDEGIRSVWIHGRDAAGSGRGADIELLARARRHLAGGRIWLSGGIAEPRHLKTLAREGGAKAAVIPAAVARQWGCATLTEALVLHPPTNGPISPASLASPCGPARNMA